MLDHRQWLIVNHSQVADRCAGRMGCSATVTATLGCDLKACLEVNKVTSVLSSFSFSMLLASHLWTSPMHVFNRVTVVDCFSGALFSNETYSCVSSA